MKELVLLCCVLLVPSSGQAYDVSLVDVHTMYLPYDYNGSVPLYDVTKKTTESVAFDPRSKLLYSIGDNHVNVIDLGRPQDMHVVHHFTVDGELTDVELCGHHIFMSVTYPDNPGLGRVFVYTTYSTRNDSMEQVLSISVDHLPDMLVLDASCSRLLVAVEGGSYTTGTGLHVNPPGAVVIISFPNGISKDVAYNKETLDFKLFNQRVNELKQAGVRFVYPSDGQFSDDVEPEYITLNEEDGLAYVCLQENNAIAVVDLATKNITAIHGLGFKNWSRSGVDPSDQDDGIRMQTWPVYGMYQPDGIAYIKWKGVKYIVTANEGDGDWREEKRGADYADGELSAKISAELKADLKNNSKLGRLVFTNATGQNSAGEYDALYTFGARGFSIFEADPFRIVYDSGSTIEARLAAEKPDIFNAHVSSWDSTPAADKDVRSPAKGPETESIAYGVVDGHLLLFFGHERPGFVTVHSIDDDITAPTFQYLLSGLGTDDFNTTWAELYNQSKLSFVDPEDIRFIPAADSPTTKPGLLITGAYSGTITYATVHVDDGMPDSSSTLGCTLGLLLLSVVWSSIFCTF